MTESVHPWRRFYQGTSSLINVVNSTDRNHVVDAEEGRDKLTDAIVFAFANTLTSSTATCSGKKLTDVCMKEDLWWWYAYGTGDDSAVTEEKSRFESLVLDLVKPTWAARKAVEIVRWPVAGASGHWRN